MEKVMIRSPIEPRLLEILETQPIWEAWKQAGHLIRMTEYDEKGGLIRGADAVTPIAKRHDELWLLWNSIAYPLGSANVPRHAWEDLLIEGIEVFKEFLHSDLADSWDLQSYHRLRDKRHARLEEWRKDPEISKLLIVYQGDD